MADALIQFQPYSCRMEAELCTYRSRKALQSRLQVLLLRERFQGTDPKMFQAARQRCGRPCLYGGFTAPSIALAWLLRPLAHQRKTLYKLEGLLLGLTAILMTRMSKRMKKPLLSSNRGLSLNFRDFVFISVSLGSTPWLAARQPKGCQTAMISRALAMSQHTVQAIRLRENTPAQLERGRLIDLARSTSVVKIRKSPDPVNAYLSLSLKEPLQ